MQELADFKERHAELQQAGIDVVALALDGVGADAGDPADARREAARVNLPFAVGRANERILTVLERLHVRLTPMELELVIPISLLVDKEGRLAVLYKGTPGVDRIVADLAHSSLSRSERLRTSTGLEGVSLESNHPSVAKAADQLEIKGNSLQVDKDWLLTVSGDIGQRVLRKEGNRTEVVVPVSWKKTAAGTYRAEIIQLYEW